MPNRLLVLTNPQEDTFNITSDNGTVPEFVGAHAKYAFKTATNFVTLEPGANASVTHDRTRNFFFDLHRSENISVGSGYNFNEEGEYKIASSDIFFYQDEAGTPQIIHATVSSGHQTKLSGNLQSSKRLGRGLEKRATFTGCSSSRRTSINNGLITANRYLASAITYLKGQTRSTKRYTTWFGKSAVASFCKDVSLNL